MRVTVAGPRDVSAYKPHFLGAIFPMYLGPFADSPSLEMFYVGGARGIDTLALRWIMEHSEAYVKVVVPFTLMDQPREARQEVAKWLKATKRCMLHEMDQKRMGRGAAQYHKRNEFMIKRSDLLISFPIETYEAEGGTWHGIRTAEVNNVPQLRVPLEGLAHDRY